MMATTPKPADWWATLDVESRVIVSLDALDVGDVDLAIDVLGDLELDLRLARQAAA